MRLSAASLLVAAFASSALMAGGGEYDSFHFGPRLGLTWSPDKSYTGLGSQAPGTTTQAEGKGQIGLTGGLKFDYSFLPGKTNLALVADFVRVIHKEAGTKIPVDQNIVRGELRFTYTGIGNMNEGTGFFVSPTYSQIHTNLSGVGSLSEHKMGGALGMVGHHFHETYLSYWEVGAYYLPKLSSGTEAGGLTAEIRFGFEF